MIRFRFTLVGHLARLLPLREREEWQRVHQVTH